MNIFPVLAKMAGKSGEVERITKDGIEGRISWKEGLKQRIKLLKGVKYQQCIEAAKMLELQDGAKEFVNLLRKIGNVKVGIITGCFDIVVNPIKEMLGLDFAVSNKLVFNGDELADVEIFVDENKALHLMRIAEQFGVKMENTIAIGDGANDISIICNAGFGIGFNPTQSLEKHAKVNLHTNKLDEALPFIIAFIKERQKGEKMPYNFEGEKLKVLVCDPIDNEGIELLRNYGFEVIVKPEITVEELKGKLADYHVLIIRSKTKITKEIIDAGENLKVIARAGAGVDNIDVEYAEKKGIKVVCTSDAVARAVAELTIGLIIALARQIPKADNAMKEGKWIKHEIKGWELYGKTIGIIGFGRIGRKVAKLAKAFEMKILVCELNNPPENLLKELDAQLMPLEELLRKSDIVTLHVPLTKQTYHMIDENQISQMKNGAYIINTSRGQVINEKALFKALETGKIAGAALDVYEMEPPEDYSLIRLPNVICTPHIGAQTMEAQKYTSLAVARKIIEAFEYPRRKPCDYKCQECMEYQNDY
ncbi:MAG: HAD-IB family phosphatase [Candidatus Bathyarchaeia archaeon]